MTIEHSAHHTESLAAKRSGPGLLIFRTPMTLVYRDPWAWRRCVEMSGYGAATSRKIPPAIQNVCEEVSEQLKVRTEPKDWEQFRVRRIVNHTDRPLLVSGLGVPHRARLQSA